MEKVEVKIQQASQADMEGIALMYQKRVAYNDAHDIHQWNYDQVTWDAFFKTYEISDYYVGKVQEEIVCGMFVVDVDALYWPDEPAGVSLYLHKICVDPAWSGYGFSDQLISYFKYLGEKKGVPEVRLDVRKKKAKLRQMYERNGFELVRYGQFLPEFETALYHYVLKK